MTLAAPTRDDWHTDRPTGESAGARALSTATSFAHTLLIRFGLIVAVLAAWELALWGRDFFQFKPPSTIFATMYATWFSGPASSLFLTPAVFNDVLPSVSRALAGWALGGIVGIVVGIAAGRSLALRGYVDPVVSYLRSIPKAALVPTFLIVFGASDATRIIAISASTVWLVLLNTMQGVRTLDPVMRDTGRAFRIPAWKQLTHIVIPAASPKIIAGLRVTLSLSLIVMLVSEWLLTDSGLGFYLLDRQRNYDIAEMWAALLLLALIGYLLNSAFLAVEYRLLRWHAGAHGRAENA
jgi:ABC-type nitrate/sulfonate/bicarbonate transport system permease component